MNRSAYLTTSIAIKTLSNLSKADIAIHGEGNIPKGPVIFVINHFTRIETFLIPHHIFRLTDVPVWSLAASSLFRGGLRKFFDLVGVISTKDPKRDELILKSLLTGEANWIIFPEGSMVKTKKTMRKGKFLISGSSGKHKPHTGAASLALRAEFFRNQVLAHEERSPEAVRQFLNYFDVDSCDQIRGKATSIVPVNLTYYPIRAKENLASSLASKLVKDIPERVVEEIMTEGTMVFSGVDLDVRFGKPIEISGFMQAGRVRKVLERSPAEATEIPAALDVYMREAAQDIMQHYMKAIYGMTTINHEHLFASFLKLYPYKKISEKSLNRRVYYAASLIADSKNKECNLHSSLKENQIHLLTDDRYGKYKNFLELALDKEVVTKENGFLRRAGSVISDLMTPHRGRIDNPIEVIANEVEPMKRLQDFIFSIAWQPDFLLRRRVIKYLQKRDIARCEKDRRLYTQENKPYVGGMGMPYLLRGSSKKIGVVLIHSYLSVPEEVKALGSFFAKKGMYVYAPRLAGHGTSPEDLSRRKYREWLRSVETGYAIMNHVCDRVVLGGVSVGGCLAFDLAARLKKDVAGVFAICSPYKLQDYSTSFMPTVDVWDRILTKVKGDALEEQYLEFSPDNPHINYRQNPVLGVREVGLFLDNLQDRLPDMQHPALILHADNDPVVDQEGSRQLYKNLGSKRKEYYLLSSDKHVIINGKGSGRVHRLIGEFVNDL